MMVNKLSKADKKILKIGSLCAAAILIYFLVISPWIADWQNCKAALAKERAKLAVITATKKDTQASVKQIGLFSIVPVFEIPQAEKEQKQLFRGKFNEQLKKAGIKIKSLQFLSIKKSKKSSAYKNLRLQCKGKCSLDQALDLLACLNNSPYFVGVQDIQLKYSNKKRKQMDMVLTVSTFVKYTDRD